MKKTLALLYVLSSLWWGPAVEASFRLDRTDGHDPGPGLLLGSGGAIGPYESHWVTQPPPEPPRPVLAPVARPPVRLPALVPSGRCGGDLPPCWVMRRESGPNGDPNAYNPTGCNGRGCYGKWQFDPRTGDGTGSEEEQDAEARRVWDNGRGCSHWDAC